MKNKFHAISMCSLMAAFATSSWATCPTELGFVEGDGEELGDLGVCYYDIPETGGLKTLPIPADLKTFKLRYRDGSAAFLDTINIHCTPQALATTVSVTGAWAQLEKGSLSIRNRINAVALGVDNSTVTQILEKYQSELDLYNCTDDYCSASSFAKDTKKVTGFNALSIVFSSTSDGEQINSFELTVNQEPYDFGPMQVYNVKGLDKDKVNELISNINNMLPLAVALNQITSDESAKIKQEVLPLLTSFSAVLAADKANVALIEGDPKPENTYDLYGLSSSIAVDSVYFDRKFTANGKDAASTIALPFGIATNNIKGALEILEFSRVANNTLYMKVVYCSTDNDAGYCPAKNGKDNGSLEAYKPYLVRLNSGASTLEFSGATTLVKTPAKTEFDASNGDWAFRGMFEKKTWNENDPELTGCNGGCAYGYAAEGENLGKFVRVGEGASIVPFRAYLVNTSASMLAPANASYVLRPTVNTPDELDIAVEGDNNQTTVIGKFNTRTGEMRMNSMKHTYDLKGRRVNGTNNARGAYYGKKVLMK